ncbi:hypothetical protein F4777DRAFT_45770 [Nemania sp. FL0916]|nr:hypothetical protein F4777DRAFT_45770 [Nemania sp. FL0916]
MGSDNSFQSEWAPGPIKDYSDNIAYEVGETVRIPWETDITNGTLNLWQDNYSDPAQGYTLIATNVSGNIFTWTVSWSGLDPSYSNVCYLLMEEEDGSIFITHYFNISDSTAAVPSPTSSSTSMSTSSTSMTMTITSFTTTPPPTSTTTAPRPTVTITTEKANGNALSSGATAGIAIGTVVAAAIVIGIFWSLLKKSKNNNNPGPAAADTTHHNSNNIPEANDKPSVHEMQRQQIYEAPGSSVTHHSTQVYEVDGTQIPQYGR